MLRRKSKKEKTREEYFVLDTAVNSSGRKSSEFYFKSKILTVDRNVPRAKDFDSTGRFLSFRIFNQPAFVLEKDLHRGFAPLLNRWNFISIDRYKTRGMRIEKVSGKIMETCVASC